MKSGPGQRDTYFSCPDGAFRAEVGLSWGSLGLSWGSLGPLLGSLRAILASLGALLRLSWALLELSGLSWGSLGPPQELPWALLELSWGFLGLSWGCLGAQEAPRAFWVHFGSILEPHESMKKTNVSSDVLILQIRLSKNSKKRTPMEA